MGVAILVDVDATVLVKSVQVLHDYRVMVGLAHPKKWLTIEENNEEEIWKFLNEFKDGSEDYWQE